MIRRLPTPILLFSLLLLLLTSCRVDTLTNLRWNSDWILPLATSESGLEDIIQDTTLSVNDEGVFALVFRDTLTSISLADLVDFPDVELGFAVRLDSISLNTDTINQQVTMGQLATQLAAQGNILGQLINNNHNKTLPFVPGVPGLSSGTIPIDASSFFEYALMDSGFLDLTISNEFPLTLENVVLEVKNATLPGPPIVRDTFLVIPSKASRTRTYDLSGIEIESQLIGELINLDLRDSTNVPIDTSEYVEVVLVARDLKAKEATAVFPAQTVLEQTRNTDYAFGEGSSAVRIRQMNVLSGKISTQTTTTIEDSLYTIYRIDNATDGLGSSPEVSLKILPAPTNGVRSQSASQDLEGFSIDMSLGGTTWNKLSDYFRAELLYSGKLVTMDQEDSLTLTFLVEDLKPTFASGYFGSDTYEFEGVVGVKWRDGLNVGRVRFSNPTISLVLDNGLGVDGSMEIRDLTATNSQNGASARLTTGALLGGPIALNRPYLPDTFGVARTTLVFDKTESNLVQILEMEADELHYDIRLTTNTDNNSLNFDDFATDRSEIKAMVDLELPLEGVLETLIIEDTSLLSPGPVQDIPAEAGVIRLLIDNDFPLQGLVNAQIQNASGNTIYILADDFLLTAATPQGNGRTGEAARSILELSITRETLESVLETGTRIVFRYELDTRPSNADVKFYADYKVKAQITVQFPVTVNE
ncbi:MAG: hypothetical protein NWR72_11480 [Bacteroidia bacterium]|nr:hypothetical protein [Bacteroidia bacterium]